MAKAVLGNVTLDCFDASILIHNQIDDAHGVQIFCSIDIAAVDHFFGLGDADATGQVTIGAHSRKQVEQHLGETKFGLPFGNDQVTGKGGFKPSAKRVTLDKGNRDDPLAIPDVVVVARLVAAVTILTERRGVPLLNLLAEKNEIAAKVEGSWGP